MIYDDWNDFKSFVKAMRALNAALIRRQGGSNYVMVAINLIDFSIGDWVIINPYCINLRTGKGSVYRDGCYYFDADVKYLLLHHRWKEERDEA